MNRCIVTNFDAEYFAYACVMLQSLADNYKKEIDVVCIVTPDMATPSWEKQISDSINAPHFNIKCRSSDKYEDFIAKSKVMKNYKEHVTPVAALKVFMGSICKEYDIAAYLDADCLVLKDATCFVEHPLYEKKIVACPEHSHGTDMGIKMPERAYFNNGVFVVDLNYWRDYAENAIVDWMVNNDTGDLVEQTAMNIVMYEDWFPMSPNLNRRDSFSEHNLYYNDPIIIHFVGPAKPWTDNTDYDQDRGPGDLPWRKVYDKVWGIENFWRPHLNEIDRSPKGIAYND